MEKLERINTIIDTESRALVGILCKRIEVLEEAKSLTPNLYKALSKEIIYEYARNIKKLIKLHYELFKVEFKTKKPRGQE